MTAEYRQAVLDNANRLLEDARVLHAGKRYPTACAMAIYALEECGKYLLDRWQEEGFKVKLPGKSSFHKQKQFATAAIVSSLAINQLIEKHHNGKCFFPDEGIEETKMAYPTRKVLPTPELRYELAKLLTSDRKVKLMHHAKLGVLEKEKHATLYIDKELLAQGIDYKLFKEQDSQATIDEASQAITLIDDKHLNTMAKILAETLAKESETPSNASSSGVEVAPSAPGA